MKEELTLCSRLSVNSPDEGSSSRKVHGCKNHCRTERHICFTMPRRRKVVGFIQPCAIVRGYLLVNNQITISQLAIINHKRESLSDH